MEEWIWEPAEIKPKVLTNRFVIVMPVFNAEDTIENAILSVLNQDFNDLAMVIRNDMSTDHTAKIIKDIFGISNETGDFYIKNEERDVLYIENKRKLYSGGNIYETVINYVNDAYAIIGQVDGDDFLLVPDAVSIIFNAYQNNSEKWLVWSQHISRKQAARNDKGFSLPLPPDHVIQSTRRYWGISHFRTFIAGLFYYVDPLDLCDPHNPFKYAKICGDASMFYPMAEMCGNEHSLFIDQPLYYYNDGLPTNDAELYKPELAYYKRFFESKPRYAPLEPDTKF